MRIHYLEIVTRDVDAVCAAYAAANRVQFGEPDAGLGQARTAALAIYILGDIHHGLWQL